MHEWFYDNAPDRVFYHIESPSGANKRSALAAINLLFCNFEHKYTARHILLG